VWDVGRGVSAKSQHPRFGKRKHVHVAEKEFCLATLVNASFSLAFSLIGYWLIGPIGVIAQVALFQRRFFQNLDHLLFQTKHA